MTDWGDASSGKGSSRSGAPTGDTASKYGTVDDTNVILFKAALDLTRKQSSTLFHTRYDSDKNNPYK